MLPEQVSIDVQTVETSAGPLNAAVLTPHGSPRWTFVVAMGYGAWVEPFELQRFRLLSGELQARLVVVETPGNGAAGSGLTRPERWALLRRSDFGPVAARMLEAATLAYPAVADRPASGERFGVLGYSLGTSVGTAMAAAWAARTGQPVDALVLVEPVAGSAWRARSLISATQTEDGLVDRALADNANVVGAVGPWDRREGGEPVPTRNDVDLALLANGLRRGNLPGEVTAARARHVVIARGQGSHFSHADACAHLARAARAGGAQVDELVMDGSHALWHSLPTVQRLGKFLDEVLGDDDVEARP